MNKNKSTYSKKDFKKEFARLMSRASISSSLSQEEGVKVIRGLNDFVQPYIPERLFRYRNCSELAFAAFDKDILYASTSDEFNDPYDCLFRYDKEELRHSIMQALSKEYVFALREYLRSGNAFPVELNSFYTKEFLDYARTSIKDASDSVIQNSEAFFSDFRKEFNENYDKRIDEAVESVKRNAYIACFSETVHSVTMWSHYSKYHQGFALEYDLRKPQMKCPSCDKFKQCDKAVIDNLYPIIYDKKRYEATNYLISSIGKKLGLPMNNPDLLAVTKCQLYKSTQWSYEKEWRLILTLMEGSPVENFYGIKHIRPTAIYYGTRISSINRKILHLIAKEKGIREYQMYIDDKSHSYTVKFRKYLE